MAPRASDQTPKAGWMIEDEIVPASTSAAAIVYVRSNFSTRNGRSAGSDPCARSVARCPEESASIAFRCTPATKGEDSGGFPASRLGRVAGDERVGERPLGVDDLETVSLQLRPRSRPAQPFPLAQKPSEAILEGFHWERVPARGGCGPRG